MTFKNIICPVCGASCDDIAVDLGEGTITVKNACKMGNAKFQEVVSDHRIRDPLLRDGGSMRIASWSEAIDRAAQILAHAKRPLIFMGGHGGGASPGRIPGCSG
jgi:formylmethanofuran dehydrogenase subunit B